MDVNTCFETTASYHTIAYYSHLVPIALTLILIVFVLIKTRFSLLAKLFSIFGLSFCLWLAGDVITWTQSNYNLVAFAWAPLDAINVVFYLLGGYFFAVLINGKDIKAWQKVALFILVIPGIYLTVSGATIPSFYQATCEANNSQFLVDYKLGIEVLVVLFIMLFGFVKYRKAERGNRKHIFIIGTALVLFFAIFSTTEYVSSQSGVYEINLYSLFILPVFLGMIIYSITNLQVFQLRSFATQLLIYVLLIMIGSQFFFLQSTTDQALTIITFLLSIAFSIFLMRLVKREAEQRERLQQLSLRLEKSNLDIAEANDKLKGLDKLKTEFLSLASHQLRSPLTAIKGYASMLDEGSFGKLDEKQDQAVKRIYTSAQGLVSIVEDLLNVSKIEQGGMKYEMMPTELAPIITNLFEEMKIPAESKSITFTCKIPKYDKFMANVDPVKMKQVFLNLTDNSLKYTPIGGKVGISLSREDNNIVFAVTDNGVGISPETKAKLFEKFSRGEGGRMNTGGSGLGLYLAKQIALAHKGDVIIESEGLGKGSTFKVVLPAVGAHITPNTMPS